MIRSIDSAFSRMMGQPRIQRLYVAEPHPEWIMLLCHVATLRGTEGSNDCGTIIPFTCRADCNSADFQLSMQDCIIDVKPCRLGKICINRSLSTQIPTWIEHTLEGENGVLMLD